ncbi:hypothetical protein ACWGJ2_13660 [Streptomyces sp. NPDC054796]
MLSPLVRTLTVLASDLRPGDVIAVGGIPHRVRDVREVYPARKRVEFEDGNAYVLARTRTIDVTRRYEPSPIPRGGKGGRRRSGVSL